MAQDNTMAAIRELREKGYSIGAEDNPSDAPVILGLELARRIEDIDERLSWLMGQYTSGTDPFTMTDADSQAKGVGYEPEV